MKHFLASLPGWATVRNCKRRRGAVAFLYREVLGVVLPWPEIGRTRGEGPAGFEDSPGGMVGKPKLLDRARAVLRARHYSWRTEECYVECMRRYIVSSGAARTDGVARQPHRWETINR